MGRFDYPSPYWDSVGDPALDLIDKMLTVDVDQRITVDECLEHPWLTQRTLNPADSTDGLTGAMDQLDFSKRKYQRERTLLSSINEVKISEVVETQDDKGPVKIFEKNANGKRPHVIPASKNANSRAKPSVQQKELTPAADRAPDEFMEMGGKGDQPLFKNNSDSRYAIDETPKQALK